MRDWQIILLCIIVGAVLGAVFAYMLVGLWVGF